jgi:hypothetical protein
MGRKTNAVNSAAIAAKEAEVNKLIKFALERYSINMKKTAAIRLIDTAQAVGCSYTGDELLNILDTYYRATVENRLMVSVSHVSSSGMSRCLKFFCLVRDTRNNVIRYNHYGLAYPMALLLDLQHKDDSVKVHGCGMDMIYHTHDQMLSLSCLTVGLICKVGIMGDIL